MMSEPSIRSTGVFPMRGTRQGEDELVLAYTAHSELGDFVFRMKFPASTPPDAAATQARRQIADDCRSLAEAAEHAV